MRLVLAALVVALFTAAGVAVLVAPALADLQLEGQALAAALQDKANAKAKVGLALRGMERSTSTVPLGGCCGGCYASGCCNDPCDAGLFCYVTYGVCLASIPAGGWCGGYDPSLCAQGTTCQPQCPPYAQVVRGSANNMICYDGASVVPTMWICR